MINENVNVYYYSSPKNDLDFYDFQDYRLVSDNYIRFGLVVVDNGKGVRNVLSLIKGNLLFAFDDSMTFDFITRTIDGNYLEAAYIYKIDVFNGKKELYDVMGNLLLEKGSYEYINVEVNLKVEFDFFWKSS